MKEPGFKIVSWVLGAKDKALSRLRSLTPIFWGTPAELVGDEQGNNRGVPGGKVAWPVDKAKHDGATFIAADSFPAEYVHKEKKVYLLDEVGKRHDGAFALVIGKNCELATPLFGDTIGHVNRSAEFGSEGLLRNVFHPSVTAIVAHHVEPEPPKYSTQVLDADGRSGGIHYSLRVRQWVKSFCQGASGVVEKIFAPLLNFTKNGDGTAAYGAVHFEKSEAVLSHEKGGPLAPADDGNHELGQTQEAKINQSGINITKALFGDTEGGIIYSPLEFINTQWENGARGPFVMRVELREDFADKHFNACGKKVPGRKKWQSWSKFQTYPTILDEPSPDKDPSPDKKVIDPTPDKPRVTVPTYVVDNGKPPANSTPNEMEAPSEYGHPVPGTPEAPKGPITDHDGEVDKTTGLFPGHDFSEKDWVEQGRVGHTIYAPLYYANTAGSGNTPAQRWPVKYTTPPRLFVAANGRVIAVPEPGTSHGTKITLAPEMTREHQFVANKDTWPTTLSTFYTIFGAGKNAAGTELIAGFGIGLRVPNAVTPASGWYFKNDYTDDIALPDLDIRSTDADGLDASAGRAVKINGTAIISASSILQAVSTADQSVTDDATLTSSTYLTVTVEASTTYIIDSEIFFTNNGTAQGIKLGLGGTCTITRMKVMVEIEDDNTFASVGRGRITALDTPLNIVTSVSGDLKGRMRGVVVVNAAGTLLVNFGMNNNPIGSQTTTLQQDSYLRAMRVG